MTWLLMLSLGLAGEIDIDDLDRWQAQTEAMLRGPEGCWAFSGRGRTTIVVYTPAGIWSRAEEHRSVSSGTFTAILDDGRWRDIESTTTEQDGMFDVDYDPSFLFGVRKNRKTDASGGKEGTATAGAVEAANVVDRIIDNIDPATTTAYAQWTDDRTAIEYLQHVPLDDSRNPKELTLRTRIPAGEQATSVDAMFPRRLTLNPEDFPFPVKVMDLQAHMRSQPVDDLLLPGAETLSMVAGVVGFTLGFEQRTFYTQARRCTEDESSSDEAD